MSKPNFADSLRRIGVDAPGGMPSRRSKAGSEAVPAGAAKERVSTPALIGALGKAAERQRVLGETALVYGVVVDVRAADDQPITLGIPVRTSVARGPIASDTAGIALTDPDDDGTVLVSFADGRVESYAAVGETGHPAEIVPDREALHRVVVSVDGRHLEVQAPSDQPIEPGDTVALAGATFQIVRIIGRRGVGELATVVAIVDERRCEVEVRGTSKVVASGEHGKHLTANDRVLVDPSGAVVVDRLPESQPLLYSRSTGVDWSNIGGQEDAVEALIEAIEMPTRYPVHYRHYRLPSPRGILLFGPPGCGKTLLCQASATAVARAHGHDRPLGFLLIKGPELLEHLVGKAERRVRAVFAWSRAFYTTHGFWPTIVFDECDAVLKKRGTGISSDATDSIVNAFLVEMGGFENDGPFVMLVTNRPDILDPAVYREGRIDAKIEVKRPGKTAAREIFRIHLATKPLAPGETVVDLAIACSDTLFDPSFAFYTIVVAERSGEATADREIPFTLGHITSGAMIAGIVNDAARLALRRDRGGDTLTGITGGDLNEAIRRKFDENVNFDHLEALAEHRRTITDPVKDIRKLRQSRS